MGIVKKGVTRHISLLLAVSLMMAAPLSYADMDVGGGFGIHITVVGNSTNTADDGGEAGEITAGVYVHSYVRYGDARREDNYIFTGEKAYFEIYAQNEEKADQAIIEIGNKEIECGKKHSNLNNGDELPSGFSEQVSYDAESMSYFECSFVLDDSLTGEKDIDIKAMDEDVIEGWDFNPELSVEVTTGSDKLYVQNKESISLDIRQPCEDSIALLEPDEDITLRSCGNYITIATH